MQTRRLFAGCIAAVLLAAAAGIAAEKNAPPPDTPLRITVVFNEYNGGKKVSSLPYVMACKASARHDVSSLEMGFRVPIKVKQDEIQFEDVGTHIDCRVAPADERGGFMLWLGVRYSAVYSPSQNSNKTAKWHPGAPLADDPIFGGFRASLQDLLLHNGQTVEAATATDPVSGHVWKVEVTLNVVK